MIEVVLLVVLVVIVLGLGAAIFLMYQRLQTPKDDSGVASLLKQDLLALNEGMASLKDGLKSHLTERLDKNQESVLKQMASSAKLIADVTERLTKLDETNRRVVDVADELKLLQNVLQNPKQRGVIGEYYLKSVLDNILAPSQYTMQYKFKDGETVDAVIYLDKGMMLPIDSKFSLENYNRLVEEKDKARRDLLAKQLKTDLKARIDETAKYIREDEGTMSFAFMFIPSEAVYYDLVVSKVGVAGGDSRDLVEYAFRDKNVIIVSPTSFIAYLQTVLQGLRSLQIEEQAKEIQLRVGQLRQHLAAYDTYMRKLGASLGITVGHFNTAHKELKKVDKDVVKIAPGEAVIEAVEVERPQLED